MPISRTCPKHQGRRRLLSACDGLGVAHGLQRIDAADAEEIVPSRFPQIVRELPGLQRLGKGAWGKRGEERLHERRNPGHVRRCH